MGKVSHYGSMGRMGNWIRKIRTSEKEKEDREFAKQLNIQFQRRVRDNPHINYSRDSFESDNHRKSIKEKVEDLLKDPFYPECELNRLKVETLLVQNELNDLKKELNETKKEKEQIQNETWNLEEIDLKRYKKDLKKYKEKL